MDHAFLAETASHALYLANPSFAKEDKSTLSIQYLAAGYLGQELNCNVTKDATGIDIASIWGRLIDDGGSSMQLLCLAK